MQWSERTLCHPDRHHCANGASLNFANITPGSSVSQVQLVGSTFKQGTHFTVSAGANVSFNVP
jgi:hypothetical protein